MAFDIIVHVSDETITCLKHDKAGFSKNPDFVVEDCTRRVNWILSHVAEECVDRAVKDCSHLIDGRTPQDKFEAMKLICCSPDYRNKDQRMADEKVAEAEERLAALPGKAEVYRADGKEDHALKIEAEISDVTEKVNRLTELAKSA